MPTVRGENRVKLDSETMTIYETFFYKDYIWDWWAASRSQIDPLWPATKAFKGGWGCPAQGSKVFPVPIRTRHLLRFFFPFEKRATSYVFHSKLTCRKYWTIGVVWATQIDRGTKEIRMLFRECERECVKRYAPVQKNIFFRDGQKWSSETVLKPPPC
jgi:hypothetical protein